MYGGKGKKTTYPKKHLFQTKMHKNHVVVDLIHTSQNKIKNWFTWSKVTEIQNFEENEENHK